MSTVSKDIADRIVKGEFAKDSPKRIVKYRNAWGGEGYGVTFRNQDHDKYLRESAYVLNPKIYWEAQ